MVLLRTSQVLQSTRTREKPVWKIIQGVWQASGDALDITDGSILRWWLWIGNLGAYSRDVIGPGVTGARVSMTDDPLSATFTFERVDGSSSHVVLSLDRYRHLDIHVS